MPRPLRRNAARTTVKRGTTSRIGRTRTREKPSSGEKGWLRWVIISFVLFPVLAFGLKYLYKSSDNKEVLVQAHQLIATLPEYRANSAYLDSLVDKCHATAFEKAYTIGGRRRANTLNEQEYLRTLLTEMAGMARQDGRQDLSGPLTACINF